MPDWYLGESPSAWRGLIAGAIVLIIVLVVCYMCVQFYKVRQLPKACTSEPFQGWKPYRPACSGNWVGGRQRCQGWTTGKMPSIDWNLPISWAPCSGSLGVPPPVYS